MANYRDDKMVSLVLHLAAEFIGKEAGSTSFITVTRVTYNSKGNIATVLFTALPENREGAALDFLNRKKDELREYVKKHAKMRSIPHFEFAIDSGEKHRQRIDDISRGL